MTNRSETADIFHVYVEADFGNELKTCTSISDNDITETHLQNAVQAALEYWNAESPANSLVYGGTYDGASDCPSNVTTPAILVRFETCYRYDDLGYCYYHPDAGYNPLGVNTEL
jgi:hypothetical protein